MRDVWERLGRVVVGGCSPAHVVVGMLLGLLAGFATGGNWTFVCLLVAAALVNVHGKSFLAAWTTGCTLAFVLGGLTSKLGAVVLDHTWAGKFVSACGESLPVALLRWNHYQLAGGLALALPLGAILGVGAAMLVRRLREDIEFAQQTRPHGHEVLPTGFAEVFFFGTSDAHAQHFTTGWLRPRGFAVAALIVPIAALTTAVLLPRVVQRELLARLSEVNGAPVTTDAIHVSTWSGEITAYDVGVADPDDLSRDRLRIGRLHAEINTAALLHGRLDADTLELTHVSFNIRRAAPADELVHQKPTTDLVRLHAHEQRADVST